MVFDRITVDPARMNGQPCLRNMHLTVRRVVELAASYPNRKELLQDYPELEDEDIRQAILYAADIPSCIRKSSEGAIIDVYVQPKASKNELVGVHEHAVKIRLTAPPVEGEANKECLRFISKVLDVSRSSLALVQGHKSRRKSILVRGVSMENLQRLLVQKWMGKAASNSSKIGT